MDANFLYKLVKEAVNAYHGKLILVVQKQKKI